MQSFLKILLYILTGHDKKKIDREVIWKKGSMKLEGNRSSQGLTSSRERSQEMESQTKAQTEKGHGNQ